MSRKRGKVTNGEEGPIPVRASEAGPIPSSAVVPKRRKVGGRVKARSFYASALSEAEQALLPEARKLEGIDEEIALLRVRLSRVLTEEPENTKLLLEGVRLLVGAVAAKYRLSKKAEGDLYQSVLGVLRGIGGVLWPEGFDVV